MGKTSKKKFKKKYIIIPAVILVVLFVLPLFFKTPETSFYDSETTKTGNIATYYSFSGNIEADEKKSLTAQNNLKIKDVLVEEGDMVAAGDVLYTVDNSNYDASLKQAAAAVEAAQVNYNNAKNGTSQQQLIQAESALQSAKLSLDNAKKTLDDTKALFAAEIVSQKDVAQAQNAYDTINQQYKAAEQTYNLTKGTLVSAGVDAASAQLKQAQATYEGVVAQGVDNEVKAETAGEVTKLYVNDDTTVMAGSSVLDMADYTVMIAKIKVDEYDVSAIKEGKEVSVMVDSLDKEIKGTVGKFSKQATEKDGISYFTADIMLPQDASLLEGMSVEVKILNQSVENVQMISMKALQFDSENKPFVYVANKKGKMTTKPVKIGINDGVAVEIKEGIQADEKVYFPKVTITPMDMMGGE